MGDIVKMARMHIHNGEISVAQEKTKARVWIPLSATTSRQALDALPGDA
jgi:hypothetical protein